MLYKVVSLQKQVKINNNEKYPYVLEKSVVGIIDNGLRMKHLAYVQMRERMSILSQTFELQYPERHAWISIKF